MPKCLCAGKWCKVEAFLRVYCILVGWVLSLLFFTILMNWIDMLCCCRSGVKIDGCKISQLIFEDNVVLIYSPKGDHQQALNWFGVKCCKVERRINFVKTEMLGFLRNSFQYTLHAIETSQKQVKNSNIPTRILERWNAGGLLTY